MDKGAEYYRLFLDGNNEGIEKIILEYRAGLQMFLLALTGDMPLAEEMTQETFVKIFTVHPPFYAKASFRTWLYTVGRNLTLSELKRRARISPLEDRPESEVSSGDCPEAQYLQTERQRALHAALGKLPPDYAEVLWLTYFEELPSKEIARIMKKSVHSVDVTRARAKERLKTQLRKDGFTDEIE